MKVIGLTGPSGAGKGTVGNKFADRGIPVIDCDAVYHALLLPPSPCAEEIAATFGKEYLLPDGTLDRRALSAYVFAHPEKLELLNRISHKYVLERVDELLVPFSLAGKPAAVIDAPTLFESGADKMCDAVVAVTASREKRLERVMSRDKISREAALSRIEAQPEDAFYTSRADFVIVNDGTEQALGAEVDSLLRALGVGT